MPKTLVDWSQVIGAIGTLVALIVAYRALKHAAGARQDLVIERQRQFELGILKDLLDGIDGSDVLDEILFKPYVLRRFQHRVDLLPAGVLPYWRFVMQQNWKDEVSRPLGYRQRAEKASGQLMAAAKAQDADPDNAELAAEIKSRQQEVQDIHAEFVDEVQGKLVAELKAAIEARRDAGEK